MHWINVNKTNHAIGWIYLLLIEFEVRTVNYGPSFFRLVYGPSANCAGHKSEQKTRGSVTYSTDWENEVSKIFIIYYIDTAYWWNTRIFPFTKKSYLHHAQWRYYFFLSRVRILRKVTFSDKSLFWLFRKWIKVVFYVEISSVSIKHTEHYIAAWGCRFHLLVHLLVSSSRSSSPLEDKILIPARSCNILYISGFKEMTNTNFWI